MTTWVIEKSYKVKAPEQIESRTYVELRRKLQALADTYIPADDAPPLGELIYRDDRHDHKGKVSQTIWVYFRNKHRKKTRFMRLRREP